MPFDFARYRNLRRSTTVGVEVVYAEVLASTMDAARAGADSGGAPGTAYVTGEQTAGRGRQGRSWASAAGSGLYVTFHLRPTVGEAAPLFSVAGGLAVADALDATSGLHVDLKWPNDVLHEGRKLCGVLAEARHGLGGVEVFLGIGVNLTTQPGLPSEVATVATSIEQAGATPPAREDLLAALADALERRVAQAEAAPAALVADWRGRLVTLGTRVCLQTPGGDVEGDAVDVLAGGELVLRLDDGREQAFAAGEVHTAPASR